MKIKHLWCVAQIGFLVLVASIGTLAQNRTPERLRYSGIINAYSPQTTTGPYEVRGPWNLQLKGNSGKADFSAALNMVLSDGWVLTLGDGNFDPNGRGPHTHHSPQCRCYADYGRISGKWYSYDYPQRKPRAHFTITLGSRHYRW
jgi:hypothetical protein